MERGDPITYRGHKEESLSLIMAIKRGFYHLSWPSREDSFTDHGPQEGGLSLIGFIRTVSHIEVIIGQFISV